MGNRQGQLERPRPGHQRSAPGQHGRAESRWGHKKHGDVKNALVDRIVARVNAGKMGFIGTHSAHFSKPLKALLQSECSWGEYVADGTTAEVIVKEPNHPICKGVKSFKLPVNRALWRAVQSADAGVGALGRAVPRAPMGRPNPDGWAYAGPSARAECFTLRPATRPTPTTTGPRCERL